MWWILRLVSLLEPPHVQWFVSLIYVINLLFWSCFFVFFYSSEYYRPHSPCSVFFYSFLKNGVTHTSTN